VLYVRKQSPGPLLDIAIRIDSATFGFNIHTINFADEMV